MKKFLFICLAMLICKGSIAFDNLIFSNVIIPQNGDADVNVGFHFDNADGYAGFGFELIVPEGVSIVKGTDGKNLITLSETACSGMQAGKTSEPKFGAYTMDNSIWINGKEGTLMTFYLHADSELEVGTQLTVTVNNAYLSPRPTLENPMPESVKLANLTFNIIIGAPADSRTTFDENSDNADVLKDATGIDVRVKRTIKANQWSTICLPFAMTEAQVKAAFGDDVKVGDFTGCEVDDSTGDIKVNFSNETVMEANHPYIIKVSSTINEFLADEVDVALVANPVVLKDKMTIGEGRFAQTYYNSFVGTYVAETEIPNYALFISDNQFWFSTGKTKMKAFRAYFDLASSGAQYNTESARMVIAFEEETTGLDAIENRNLDASEYSYDLLGRREPVQPTNRVIIKNGKKVIIK